MFEIVEIEITEFEINLLEIKFNIVNFQRKIEI